MTQYSAEDLKPLDILYRQVRSVSVTSDMLRNVSDTAMIRDLLKALLVKPKFSKVSKKGLDFLSKSVVISYLQYLIKS